MTTSAPPPTESLLHEIERPVNDPIAQAELEMAIRAAAESEREFAEQLMKISSVADAAAIEDVSSLGTTPRPKAATTTPKPKRVRAPRAPPRKAAASSSSSSPAASAPPKRRSSSPARRSARAKASSAASSASTSARAATSSRASSAKTAPSAKRRAATPEGAAAASKEPAKKRPATQKRNPMDALFDSKLLDASEERALGEIAQRLFRAEAARDRLLDDVEEAHYRLTHRMAGLTAVEEDEEEERQRKKRRRSAKKDPEAQRRRLDVGASAAFRARWAAALNLTDAALTQVVEAGRSARQALVASNMRLVFVMAKKHEGRGVGFSDLVQEGSIGLMCAAEKYDPGRGYKFSTYAFHWIRQAMLRCVACQSRLIRLPMYVHDEVVRLHRHKTQFLLNNAREPTDVELATALESSPAKVKRLIDAAVRSAPVSIDDTLTGAASRILSSSSSSASPSLGTLGTTTLPNVGTGVFGGVPSAPVVGGLEDPFGASTASEDVDDALRPDDDDDTDDDDASAALSGVPRSGSSSIEEDDSSWAAAASEEEEPAPRRRRGGISSAAAMGGGFAGSSYGWSGTAVASQRGSSPLNHFDDASGAIYFSGGRKVHRPQAQYLARAAAHRKGGGSSGSSGTAGDRPLRVGDTLVSREPAGETALDLELMHGTLLRVLEDFLTPDEQFVIRHRFGFDDGRRKTQAQIAALRGVDKKWVKGHEASGLRKLRHPHPRVILDGFNTHKEDILSDCGRGGLFAAGPQALPHGNSFAVAASSSSSSSSPRGRRRKRSGSSDAGAAE